MRTAASILADLRIPYLHSTDARFYSTCPKCSRLRKPENQNLKCLGVTIHADGVGYRCAHCDWSGADLFDRRIPDLGERCRKKVGKVSPPVAGGQRASTADRNTGFAMALWAEAVPLAGTLGERYLIE